MTAGLLTGSVIFGLAHSITPTYALLAGLLGMYLGVVFTMGGEANLIPPILSHALYDLVAFIVFQREARCRHLARMIHGQFASDRVCESEP